MPLPSSALAGLAFLIAAIGLASAGPGRLPAPDWPWPGLLHRANIIDGRDDRDSLLVLAPSLGLSQQEVERIRRVSGYVGCLSPSPSVGSGALYLTNRQVLTAGHIFFEPSGRKRSKCFFRNQAADWMMIDLLLDPANARFGASPPKPGSNDDWAVVRLAEPIPGAEPFPVADAPPVAAGDRLIVVTAHPAGMEKEVDKAVPVTQGCSIRRAPISSAATSFYRTDCDASGSSSGGMHLARVDGRLVFRGMTITTGPWREDRFRGAPYDERTGSVTTALGTDAAVLEAGRSLAERMPAAGQKPE
ncbi:trypsin-like serine peptidase [Faunimonas sp. B44]|uniref:trypsin-like serine peptidase n=1 Tax=Faunimonas sp. B44 TaxID=3461493 RepID=UPI004044E82B